MPLCRQTYFFKFLSRGATRLLVILQSFVVLKLFSKNFCVLAVKFTITKSLIKQKFGLQNTQYFFLIFAIYFDLRHDCNKTFQNLLATDFFRGGGHKSWKHLQGCCGSWEVENLWLNVCDDTNTGY